MPKRKAPQDEPTFGVIEKPAAAVHVKAARAQRAAAAGATGVSKRHVADDETRRAIVLARLSALEADNFQEDERAPLNLEAGGLYTDDADTGVVLANASKRKKKSGGAAVSAQSVLLLRRLTNVRGALLKPDEIAAAEAGAVVDEGGRVVRDRKKRGQATFSESSVSAALADPPVEPGHLPSVPIRGGTASLALVGGLVAVGRTTGVEHITGNTSLWAHSAHHYLAAAAAPAKRPAIPFCGVCGDRGKYACMTCGARVCSKACQGTHSETRCLK